MSICVWDLFCDDREKQSLIHFTKPHLLFDQLSGLLQYGLLHYYGTSVGPDYKLTYFKSTPVSFTDPHGAACFNAPVFYNTFRSPLTLASCILYNISELT